MGFRVEGVLLGVLRSSSFADLGFRLGISRLSPSGVGRRFARAWPGGCRRGIVSFSSPALGFYMTVIFSLPVLLSSSTV